MLVSQATKQKYQGIIEPAPLEILVLGLQVAELKAAERMRDLCVQIIQRTHFSDLSEMVSTLEETPLEKIYES